MALQPRGPHLWSRTRGCRLIAGAMSATPVPGSSCCRRVREVVFHIAGVAAEQGLRGQGESAMFYAVGTQNVLENAEVGPGGGHVDALADDRRSTDREVLDEDSPFRLDDLRIDYVHAKRAAERIALEHAAAGIAMW